MQKKPCLLFFRLVFFLLSSRFSHKCKITTFLCCHHIFLLLKRIKNKRQQRAYRFHRNHTHCTQLFYIYRILLLHQTIKFRLAFFFLQFAVVLIIGQAALIRSFWIDLCVSLVFHAKMQGFRALFFPCCSVCYKINRPNSQLIRWE